MFLQKQTAFTGQWEVTIDYQSPQEAHEAGTAVWWSKYAYASLGIRGGEGGQRYIVFRSPDPDPDSAEANKFLVCPEISLSCGKAAHIARKRRSWRSPDGNMCSGSRLTPCDIDSDTRPSRIRPLHILESCRRHYWSGRVLSIRSLLAHI